MTVGPSLQDGDHVVHQGLLAVALHRRWVSVSRRVNDLGAKIGQFADDRRKSYGTSRDEVYRIFTEYERWKNSQDLYDRMDLVSSIHRRLSDTPYKQRDAVKIDSMSVDEVQDFTQVGFTSPRPGPTTHTSTCNLFCRSNSFCHAGGALFVPSSLGESERHHGPIPLPLFPTTTVVGVHGLTIARGVGFRQLAGDTCQTIARGVGFRFDEIRSMFFEMKDMKEKKRKKKLVAMPELTVVPGLTNLFINYRTHDGILAEAAEVVEMLQVRTDYSS